MIDLLAKSFKKILAHEANSSTSVKDDIDNSASHLCSSIGWGVALSVYSVDCSISGFGASNPILEEGSDCWGNFNQFFNGDACIEGFDLVPGIILVLVRSFLATVGKDGFFSKAVSKGWFFCQGDILLHCLPF